MKRRLYLIGDIFQQNLAFKAYILRTITADGELDTIEFFTEADRLFNAELEHRTTNQEHLYIVTHKKSFTLVGKLLCTLIDDKLVLQDQALLPSKCEKTTATSYLLRVKNASVNVLEVQESQKLPVRLLPQAPLKQKLHFFHNDIKTVIDLLSAPSRQFDVQLSYSQQVNGWIEVDVTCNTYGSIEKFMQNIKRGHHDEVIIADDLVQHIIERLIATEQKITFAESCTGGLLATMFTAHAGVSSVFEGSLVTYSNILKESWIAVENSTLVAHGAVSEPVVSEMTEGALSIANADYALAVSGIAGPDGGSETKPVGTVVIGVRSKSNQEVITHHFQGDRNYVQQQSALSALKMLVLGDKKVFFAN